ncbi:MAG: DJ-1/PfpI family protein [bacterium]
MLDERLLLITGDYAEDYEVMVPYQALQMVGYPVDTVAPNKKPGDSIHTAVHYSEDADTYLEREGHPFEINSNLNTVDVADYVGLVLPGGRAPEYIRLNDRVIEIVRMFFEEDKAVAAICHAAQILVASDVLEDRTITAYQSLKPDVEQAGATWSEENPTVDDNLVTAQAWPAQPKWLSKFLQVLDDIHPESNWMEQSTWMEE